MKSVVTKSDMQLKERIFRYSSPENLPVSFEYAGKKYHGIPKELSPKVERKVLDSTMIQHTVYAMLDRNLMIQVEATEYMDFAATEIVMFFKNIGAEDTELLSNARIEGRISGDSPVLYYGNGDTCRENGYQWFTSALSNGPVHLETTDGTSCNGAFPYMRLIFPDCGVNIGIGWPVGWQGDFSLDGGAAFAIGQQRFSMVLHSGEIMRTPRINFVAYIGDESRGRNMWRRWYMEHILPKENGKPISPKLCLHTLGVEGHPEFTGITEENQIRGIDDYLNSGMHPDVWWIDAGWYPCNYVWPDIGTWKVDEKRMPNGLGPVGKKCQENGIKLLLWFEPERAVEGSELPTEHPQWMLRAKDKDGNIMRNCLVNLGNQECCSWVIDRVDSIIKDSHVEIYRQDFNFAPKEYWKQNESENRQGALENLHAQGYLRYWDALIEKNPGLIIDSCASGGRRNDLETMRRAVPFHYTDVGYGNHPIKQLQHREMFEWIPYFRAHNQSWDNPDGSYTVDSQNPVDEFAFYAAMAPALTDMTEHDASQEAKDLSIRMTSVWRKAAEMMLTSDYYPLTECRKSAEDFYAMQFHNPDTDAGFVQILRNTCEKSGIFTAHFNDLSDGRYLLTSSLDGSSFVMTSEEMKAGLSVSISKRSSVIYFYHKL